ncbi:unnamed protein product [Coccothraustes coccothraustes]
MKVGESNRNSVPAWFFIFPRHLLPCPGVCTSTDVLVSYREVQNVWLAFRAFECCESCYDPSCERRALLNPRHGPSQSSQNWPGRRRASLGEPRAGEEEELCEEASV